MVKLSASDEFPELKSILRETRIQHSQSKTQHAGNVQISSRVSTDRDRTSENVGAMGAYAICAMNSSQPRQQHVSDGSASDGASVMDKENSVSTVLSSDNEILHTSVIVQSQHPSQLHDSGDTVNSTPLQNRYSALADSDDSPVAHQAANEYSDAMQQLLERVGDSNSSQTPETSGQNTDNNVLGHVGKVPDTVPSVNKLNPNISQPIPIQTQTPDLNFAVLNVCGLKTRSLYPEFQELVSNYSMFFVCKTKLDTTDLISINGYTFINQP